MGSRDYESVEAMADVPNFLGKHDVVVLEDYVVVDKETVGRTSA